MPCPAILFQYSLPGLARRSGANVKPAPVSSLTHLVAGFAPEWNSPFDNNPAPSTF
jgi:hypothetical protein